ncbi:MAG: hypothetical protein MRK02_13025 [Candidatus Scalindua sp.]|nr:hypothetical protein [Candidatus Scalindua sp.]
MTGKIPKRRNICNNCHNQHGCLTDEPLCLLIERKKKEMSLSGKDLMRKRNILNECHKCSHFNICWAHEAYKTVIQKLKRK